ncbi:hypothetical protein C1H46_000838 [Malus baccata]|uniref:Uncharacterized protein n=1 Tax=Malus baccata TaxID=106549 RepID=A0A540NR67_MALBA|nr:hypothetical protein C1H46_000838 [Malus baccata]
MPIQFSDNSTVMMPTPIFGIVVEAAGGGVDGIDLTGGIHIVDAGDFDGSDAVQNNDFLHWVHIDAVGAGIGDGHQWQTWVLGRNLRRRRGRVRQFLHLLIKLH